MVDILETDHHIHGQCEEGCGKDYDFKVSGIDFTSDNVKCPHCGAKTSNWDTVGSSQLAPTIIQITK